MTTPFPEPNVPQRKKPGWSLLWLLVLLTGSSAWSAGEPLWRRAMNDLANAPHYWAHTVASKMVVYDGDNQELGNMVSRTELALGKDGPVWKTASRKKNGDPGMIITMDFGYQQDAREILKDYSGWVLLRTDVVEQVPVEVWQGKAPAEPDYVAVAFLEPGTARPRRIQIKFPYRAVVGTLQISIDVDYAGGPDNTWLPRRATVEQTGRLLLRKRRIHVENDYQDWRRAEPAAPAPAKAS